MKKRLISMVLCLALVLCYCVFPTVVSADTQAPTPTSSYTQNFDSIAVGTKDAALAQATGFSLTAEDTPWSHIGSVEVVSDNGTNKMKVSGGSPDYYNQVDYTFPTAISTGVIESSLKTDVYDVTAGAHAFLGVLNGATNRGMISSNGSWYYFPADNLNGAVASFTPVKNATTGMYHLRTVIYRDKVSQNWTAEIYDDGGESPSLLYSTSIDANTHSTITGIRLTNTWPNKEQILTIDDVKIDYYKNLTDYFPAEKYEGYKQNFEDIAVGTEGSALETATGLVFSAVDGQWDGPGTIKVVEDNGTKKISLQGTNGGAKPSYNQVDYNFPNAIKQGVIEAKLDANISDLSTGIIGGLHIMGSGKFHYTLTYNPNNGWNYFTDPNSDNSLTGQTGPSLNQTTGMYNLRLVLYRDSVSADWNYRVYDDSTTEPTMLYSSSLPAANFSEISGLELARTYPLSGAQNLMLDNIEINYFEKSEDYFPPTEYTGYSQDFDDILIGTEGDALATASGLTFSAVSSGTWQTAGTPKVIMDDGTMKLLLKGGEAGGVYNNVEYIFPEPITTGVIQSSMSVGIDNIANLNHFLNPECGANVRLIISAYNGWNYFTTGHETDGVGNQVAPTVDPSTGMYNLRTVLFRKSATDNWNALIYDDGGATPKLLFATSISASTHQTITGIRLVNTWPFLESQETTIDDINIEYNDDVTEFFKDQTITYDGYSQDFESQTLAETGLVTGGNATASIVTDNGTNKLLLEGGTPPDVYGTVDYKLPVEINKGCIEASIKADIKDIEAGAHAFLGVMCGTANHGIINGVNGGWAGYPIDYPDGMDVIPPTKNADTGMYHLRLVIYRDDMSDDWLYEVYDDGGYLPFKLYSSRLSCGDYPMIDGIRLLSTWPLKDVQDVMIDDFSVRYCDSHEDYTFNKGLQIENLASSLTGSNLTVSADVKTDMTVIPFVVAVATYDSAPSTGAARMKNFKYETVTPNSDGSSKNVSILLNNVSSGDVVNVFFLENLNTIKPIKSNEIFTAQVQ